MIIALVVALIVAWIVFGYVFVSSIDYAWQAPVLGWDASSTIACILIGAPLWPVCAPISYAFYKSEIYKDKSRDYITCLPIRPRLVFLPEQPIGVVSKCPASS